MAVVGELVTLLLGNNTQLLASVGQSEAALKGYSTTASTHHGIVAGAAHAAGLAMLATGAVAAVGLGLAAKSAGDFQEQMAIINTIAHQTPAELTKTGDSIRSMAVSSGTSLDDLTKAFYDLLSAGVPASHAISVLGQANTLAIGGLATTSQTVDLLTTAINAYHLSTGGAKVATDQFALAVQDGKVVAAEIAATFADVAPLAKQAGVGIDEITTSYAVLTARGTPAAEAMTQMNRVMVELLKPNKDLSDLSEKTHLNFAKIAADKGLVVALQEMREAATANHVPFQDLFGRLEGLKFALATTGPNFAAYAAELDKMHHANGTAAAQAEERMGTFHRQTAILGETFNNLLITVGTPLLPFLTDLVGRISAGAQAIDDWASRFPNFGAALASIPPHLAALANDFIGRIPQMAQAFAGWVAPMIPGVIASLGDLAAQVANWITAQIPGWTAQLATWANEFIGWISPIAADAIDKLGTLAANLAEWIQAQVPGWTDQLGKWADAFVDWAGPVALMVIGKLGDLASTLVGWLQNAVPVIAPAAASVGGAIVDAIATALVALPGRLADAIGTATKNFDPAQAATNLHDILQGTVIIGAVVLAGQAVGAAYALATSTSAAVVNKATTAITAAWAAEQGAISRAVAVVGSAVGAAFMAAFRIAATAVGVVAGPIISAFGLLTAPLAAAMAPIGAAVGAALDAAIAVGVALGVPVLVGLIIAAVGVAIAALINQTFPGLAKAMADNFARGAEAAKNFLLGLINWIGTLPAQFLALFTSVGKAIADGILAGIGNIGKTVGDKLNEIPGVSLVGGAGANIIGGVQGLIPHAEGAWTVPSITPALLHPGEMVVPSAFAGGLRSALGGGGAGGGEVHVTVHTHHYIDGREISETVEEHLFRNASNYSSGFLAAPGTTGA